jgi:hypothetical protein
MQYDEMLITLEGPKDPQQFFWGSSGPDIRNSTAVCDVSQVSPTRPGAFMERY